MHMKHKNLHIDPHPRDENLRAIRQKGKKRWKKEYQSSNLWGKQFDFLCQKRYTLLSSRVLGGRGGRVFSFVEESPNTLLCKTQQKQAAVNDRLAYAASGYQLMASSSAS